MRLFWALHHGLERASRRMEAELGVTGQQRLVLRIVGHCPGITAGRLAQILHLDPSTLTVLLHRLELRRLVVRRAHPRDGRRAVFALTARGRRIDARSHGTIEGVIRETLSNQPPSRLRAVRGVLTALSGELVEWAEAGPARASGA
jgi:DNA-binding MarR family transcriptional regulator